MAEAVRWLFGALMVASTTTAVFGNLLLLLLLLLRRELRSDTRGFTLSFGVSDLALGLSTIPFGAYSGLTGWEGPPSEGPLCQGSAFLFLLLQTASLHSLAWATVDKFTEICFALSYRSLWTAARSRAALVLIWIFSLLSAALPLLGFGQFVYSESRFLCCLSFTPEHRAFVVLWMAAGVVAPIVTMCSLYGYIVYVARKQARRGTFRCNEQHCFYVPANTYLRSSVVMVTNSVCLLLCWLPYISVCLYETFSGLRTPSALSALSCWLSVSSAAFNPWISILTQTYRDAARRSLGSLVKKCTCTEMPVELRPQSASLQMDATNRISTTTTTTTTTTITPHPTPSPKLQRHSDPAS